MMTDTHMVLVLRSNVWHAGDHLLPEEQQVVRRVGREVHHLMGLGTLAIIYKVGLWPYPQAGDGELCQQSNHHLVLIHLQ